MNLTNIIKNNFFDSINIKKSLEKSTTNLIVRAGEVLANCLNDGGKVLSCGNGGSSCDASHFATEMISRFMINRAGRKAYALSADSSILTAIANDYGYHEVFARQIQVLGSNKDILLAISTSGNSENIIKAIFQAHKNNMNIIALTGNTGGQIASLLNNNDIEIRIPTTVTPRIQEIHLFVIHCLCELVDNILLKNRELV